MVVVDDVVVVDGGCAAIVSDDVAMSRGVLECVSRGLRGCFVGLGGCLGAGVDMGVFQHSGVIVVEQLHL